SPAEVLDTLNLQNLVLPSGTAKIGGFEYDVTLNAAPRTVAELADVPLKVVGNSTIYLRDVANVRDGFGVQTNIVRRDGRRGTLLTVLKSGNVSTLEIVDNIRRAIPRVASTLPPELKVDLLADQSVFVRSAVGETINIMTLGGLALAVGILVDDATVTIENIERYLEEGRELRGA